MKLLIRCECCNKVLAEFDTMKDTSIEWAQAPCGEKVCEECCSTCAREHDTLHPCVFRIEAGYD